MKDDRFYMREALREGRKGLGRTSPNPPVGAVVVDPETGGIVARGYHRRAGEPHAEVEALRRAGERARGATLYVTLEPCNHHGRTPPCTEAILAAGIRRVVAGTRDPNPKARGGLEYLRSRGLEVRAGVLERECRYLCRFFLKRVLTGVPWVILKVAASLDGRIATRTGDSRWITGEEARRHTHRLRDLCDAILVGKNTVLADDPELTCRIPGGRNPIRIVLDTRLRLSPEFKVFKTAREVPTWIVCGEGADPERERVFKALGVEVIRVPEKAGRVDLGALLEALSKREILSVLVEGGGEVHGAFLDEGLADEIFFFVGPVIIGGKEAPQAVAGKGPARLSQALWLKDLRIKRLGNSLLLHGLSEAGLRILESTS
ncbi:bifunctional diaminohydroxyphosphoribosylaminopyrimidine deaminase/5-amino-6-(5-phosphoribosylamino)uracil reductase RibD [Thermosulfurimonas sp. F29]|uniref:bifunctional diaminohydroxyphosphoribosylaminopyrimidine deaminase/5-amino-6-(5-phosphoribosylamino)uracil reductase RibD n=1 Tax=Thermosulfurimonas sp. F29 TaxID=2867247 RepID=UPI001C83BB15|nr:bifunctional diaminohydroxyphosphoribosylaminopyrimidine deaminase/5-amino-6-(5-phosphoribosylamino)uracil reductase RibD [Thermosulfurimonas sp. F29]MBX6422878.1 bifunctional diaminohydroxyphosphoribosylaminopyrimidine deaminase/5-amino-6-(5-phosphoribosylamino)uracil reductase RibD [Thermosulfurimonas sp. F29]